LIAGLSALSFLVLGGAEILIFLGSADILVLLFGHSHSIVDLPFQLQTFVIAGLSIGLCILAASLTPALWWRPAKSSGVGRIICSSRYRARDQLPSWRCSPSRPEFDRPLVVRIDTWPRRSGLTSHRPRRRDSLGIPNSTMP